MMRFIEGKMRELSPAEGLASDQAKGREFTRRARVARVAEFTSWQLPFSSAHAGGRASVAYDVAALFGSLLTVEDGAL